MAPVSRPAHESTSHRLLAFPSEVCGNAFHMTTIINHSSGLMCSFPRCVQCISQIQPGVSGDWAMQKAVGVVSS